MEFYTISDEGLHAGIEVALPHDTQVSLDAYTLQRVIREIAHIAPTTWHGSRILLAGGDVAVRNDRLVVSSQWRPCDGAVLLAVDLPPGEQEDGTPIPVRVEGDGVLELQVAGARRFFVVPHISKLTIERPTGVMPSDELLMSARLRRVTPGADGPLPVRPHEYTARGWLAQVEVGP